MVTINSFIQSQQSYSLMQALIVNTKNMEDVFRSNERSSNSLEIMQIILAGSLAFDILDRLSTCYVAITPGTYAEWFSDVFIKPPVLWVLINLGFWAVMSFCLVSLMRALSRSFDGTVSARLIVNRKMSVMHLEEMLESKEVAILDRDSIDESRQSVENVKFKDASDFWASSMPKMKSTQAVRVELIFDRKHQYLLRAFVSVPSASDVTTTAQLKLMLIQRLQGAGVLPTPRPTPSMRMPSIVATSRPGAGGAYGQATHAVHQPVKLVHNARELSSRFHVDREHAKSYNWKREMYRIGLEDENADNSHIFNRRPIFKSKSLDGYRGIKAAADELLSTTLDDSEMVAEFGGVGVGGAQVGDGAMIPSALRYVTGSPTQQQRGPLARFDVPAATRSRRSRSMLPEDTDSMQLAADEAKGRRRRRSTFL